MHEQNDDFIEENMNLFQLFSLLVLLESTVNCLKSKKLQRNVPIAKFMVCGWKMRSEMTSDCTSFLLCCRMYNIIFFVVLNPSFSSHTYLFSSLEQRSTKSNESQKDVQKVFCLCVSFIVGHSWEWQGYWTPLLDSHLEFVPSIFFDPLWL